MNYKIKILILTLLASALLAATNLNVQAQGTTTVAILASNGGTTDPAGGTNPTYTIGQTATFTATPSSGWQFFYWIVTTAAGSTTYTTNPLSWNVTGAGSAQAMFLPTTNATVAPSAAGTTSLYFLTSAGGDISSGGPTTAGAKLTSAGLSGKTQDLTIGTTYNYSATPGSGFTFVAWVLAPSSGGVVFTSNPLLYNASQSCAIQALFIPNSSTVTLPTIINEYSSAATVGLTVALLAVAFGAFAIRRKPKN
jgi:hypothetical protein